MAAVTHRERLFKAYQVLRSQQFILRLHLNLRKMQLMKKRLRRWWVKPHIEAQERDENGGYNRRILYLKRHDHEEFYNLFHMSPHNFDRIHDLVRERLQKQINRRPPISTEIRLASVLMYLANGGSVKVICSYFLIGRSTFYRFVAETCSVLKVILSPLYLRLPSQQLHWLSIIRQYQLLCQHPYCFGSLDTMQVWMRCPPHSGTLFHNYKGYYSVVLMTLSDAHRRVTWYSYGDFGHLSDSSVYSVSELRRKLANNALALPGPRRLPDSDLVLPPVILADEIFPLGKNLMKPYTRRRITGRTRKMYNFMHSHGRMPVECQYGMLQKKWEILQQPIGFDLEVTRDMVIAMLAMHNYLINSKNPELDTCEPRDEQMDDQDLECPLTASEIRDGYADYFAAGGPGHEPWTERFIR